MRTLRRNRRPLGLVLSALLLVWQIQQPLAGATLIWDSDTLTSGAQDGAGTWTVGGATFWNGTANVATTNDLFGDIALFGNAGAGGTVNVGTQSVRGLVFGASTSGYTLTNSAASVLTLGTSGITVNSGAQPVTVGSTNLGLALGTNSSIVNNSGGLFTVGGALNTAGNALIFDGTSNTTVSGIISGAGALTKNGSADLNFNGVNTGTGAITVNNGKIIVGASAKLSGAAALNINSGGTVQISGGTNAIDDGSVVTVNAGGTLLLNGGATETIARLAGAGVVDRTVAGNQVLTVSNTTSNTFSGIIQNTTGTLALTKTNTNTLTLTGTSTYTGATIINRGFLTVSSLQNAGVASSIGMPTGTTSDITFNNNAASQTSGLTYSGTTAASTDRVLSIALGSGAITTAHTITISNTSTTAGANLVFTSNLKNTTNTSALAPTLIFGGTNPAADVNEFRGNLINSTATGTKLLNVSKSGTNTWKLGGTNTYTGTTTISAGTLIFGKQVSLYNNTPASWTATNITVSSGATLGLNVGGTGEFTSTDVATIAALGTATNGFLGGSAIALDTTNATGNFVLGTSLTNTNAGANALGLTKLGTGTLELTAANSYTGTTTVTAGTLLVSGSGSIGSGGVTMTGGTLDLGGTTPTVGAVSLAGTSTLQNGSLSGTSYAASPATGNTVTVTANLLANGASGLTKSGAGILSVSGANTFTGGVTVSAGTLQFSTVSDNGGAASNLGQGTDAITLSGSGILSFVGGSNQSTNRAVTLSGAATLDGSGTSGATISYTGAINTSGNTLTLTGTTGGSITGGVIQTGTAADLSPSSGTWNFSTGTLVIADDFINSGPTVVTNLNTTGILTYTAGTSNGLYIRNGATVNLNANDVNGAANSGSLDFILMGDVVGTPATLNTNTFGMTTPRLDVGAALIPTGEASVIGSGTLTVTTALNLYRGSIAANLTGAAALLKQSPGTVTLSGDTSGLTGVTTLSRGTLALDYTTNNTSKLSDSAVISAAGGTLSLTGNTSGATLETIGGITIGVGSTRLVVNNGTGQTAALNVNGITRSAIGGTLDVTLSSGSASVATSTANGAGTILGGWATVGGSNFATVSGGNIISFTSTAKDDVSTWAVGDDVTDSTGFTGSLNNLSVNSLRFGSAATSTVTINADNRLNIGSSGILVTTAVGAGPASITGGILSGGTLNEIIVHQNNTTSSFAIGSNLLGGSALTKTGAGTLTLSGNNTFHGTINVNDGTLIPSGGKAIGDFSLVALKSNGGSVFDLNNGTETIGALGSTAVFSTTGIEDGMVSIGTGTLTINNTVATRVYQGSISGTGTIVKNGVSSQAFFGGATGGFTGNLVINQGLIDLSEGATVLNTASSIVINGPGELISDQETSASVDHIGNSTPITLNNTVIGRGLWVRNPDQGAGRSETVGAITLGFGHNVIQVDENGATSGSARTITATAASLDRGTNHATLLVRGQMMGLTSGERGQLIFSAAPTGAIGGGGAAASTTINIFPYMVGESAAMTDATLTDNYGNSFVMNTGTTNGLRPLDLATEYTLNQAGFDALTGTAVNNVRFALNPAGTLAGTATQINSLVLDSSTEALTVNGPASSLNIKSGAILATTTTPANAMTLGGFTGLTTDAGNDYTVYVTNPTSTFTLNTPLTTAAPLVKAGAGTLVLGAVNSTTDVYFNHGLIQTDALNKLGTGDLKFQGGGLRWATGATFDPSTKVMSFGSGGGSLDTNGNNVTLANAVGNGGIGGLTKLGTGILTLNAPVTYTGTTIVTAGTLQFGVAAALPSNASVVLNGGTLDTGAFVTALGNFSVQASSTLTGSANVTFTGDTVFGGGANRVLTVNNSGLTTITGGYLALVDTATTARTQTIAGTGAVTINSEIQDGTAAGSLTITNTNTTTLTGHNTYSGTTTMNAAAGTLVFSGDNRTAGVTTLTAGTIQLNNALNGGLASGLVTLTSGTVQAVNAARTLSNNVNLTAATISGTQSLTINGTVTGVTGGSRTLDSSITGGTLTLGDVGINAETANARTLTITGTGATTINGIISNGNASTNNGLIITNSNTTTLAGANTYSGDTMISAGITKLGNSNVIPDGAGKGNLSIAGGATLDLNGKSDALNGLSGAGTIDSTAAGAMSLSVGGNNQTSTFSGSLANTAGTLSLTKTGTGDFTLSGTSTYSGSTTVSGGKLYVDSATAFPATTAGLTLDDGAEFHLRGTSPLANVVRSFSGTGNVITVGSTTGGVLGFGIDGLFNSQLNLAAGQTMAVNGTLTTAIHVNNAPTAGLNYVLINAADDNAIFGSGTFDLNPVVFNGGSFTYALDKITVGAGEKWVLTPTSVAAADNVWWRGDLGGIGTGVWSASTTSGTGFPTNWDTDQTTGTDAAVPPDSGSIVHFSATGATNFATTLGANLTIQELIVHSGGSAVSVGGANTLTIGNATDAAGITLQTGAPNLSFSSNVAMGKAQSFNIADASSTLTFTGALSGVGPLGINDNGSSTGTMVLGGAAGIATYSGATNLAAGKLVLQGGASNRLPTTTALTMGNATQGATLQLGDGSGASSTTIGTLNTGAATTNAIVGGATTASTLTIVQAADGSFNGAIGGAGTNENQIAIVKQGGSTLTLNGANTYVGSTTINDGTLMLGTTASLSGSAGLSIVAGAGKTAAFDLNGRTATLAGAVTLGGGDSAASASILNSTTGGLLTLGGNVTYDATNNPLASVINANLSNGTAARTFTVNDSTTVASSSSELTLNGTYASANSATVTGTGNMTINGAWTLTGSNLSLTKSGTGTLTINAATNTTGTGDWNINAGVVNATAGNSLNAADNVIVTGTGVQDSTIVNISGASVHQGNDFYIRAGARVNVTVANGISTGTDQILIGDINSVGAAAAARLDLAANISSGNTLQLGGAGGSLGNITGTGAINSTNGYSLRAGSIASGITLAGTGAITKVTDGTVTFAGTRTTSGATNIQEGSLVLDYTTNNTSKIGGVLTLGAAQGNLTSPTSLVINGNDSSATAQSVTSTTISNTGHTLIDINNGTSQTAALALNAITRSVVGGTVGFDYASTSATATTTNAATNSLGWATVTTSGTTRIGAIDGTGNIIQGVTDTQNSVTSWIDNTNVINSGGGYSGTISSCVTISSLTFDAAAASTVAIATGQVLNITSGGILVNSTVGSFASTISGGSIYGANATNPGELIVHQNNSAAPLTISSSILASSGVTKSGAGILVLSGNNNYLATGSRLTINEGTVRVAGGNAIGDTTTVMMRSSGSLDLNNTSEAIGNLGADSTNFSSGGIDLGTGTITINQTTTSGFVGAFTGGTTSTIVKNGTGTLTVQGNSPGFSGTVRIDNGQIALTGNYAQFSAATAVVLNGAGNLAITQDQDANVNRVSNTATITLNNTALGSGLSLTDSDNTASNAETVGALTLGAGHNIITATSSQAATVGTLTLASLAARNNRATLLVRGAGLGDSAATQRGQLIFSTAPGTGNAVIGGGGAAGTTNTSIFAWMVGETSATGVGNSFVRNTGTTNGLKPLDLTTEYINNNTGITGTLTDNVRFTATAAIASTPTAINSLVLDSATGVALTGSASFMEITSGAVLAAGAGSHSIGGITGLTTAATRDYNIFVTNSAGVLSIDTALATVAPLVKSGAGTLKLTSTSNAINAIYLNQGNLLIDDLDKTGTGTLNFHGGTLKLDTTFADDLGGKTMVAGTGGGTIDVGALTATATGLNLSGAGSFTKTGTGTLTIGDSTTITHSGQVIVAQGTLVLNNTTGTSIGTGGLLISGTSNPTTVQLTQNNQIANTAPITLTNNGSNNQTLDLNGFTDAVGAVTLISSSTTGTVIKTGATGVLTLNGDLTLTNNRVNDGGTTEFQVLITGSGAVGTRTTDGTLDLGGVNRRIIVDSVITNPNRNDAVIETVIQNGGIIKSGSRALYLTNVNTYTGPTNIQQGTVVINSAQSIGDGSATNSITLANGSTLRSTGANVDLGVNRTLTLSGVIGGTLEVTGTNKLTASGPIVGDDCMQLTKAGTGALILTNDANSYAGGTLVSAGTLDVSNTTGSGTGTGALTVAAGATLSGSGVISPNDGKNIIVNGTLSPGALGALTGTNLEINLTGASTLALNGAVNFTLFGNDNLGTLNPLTQNTSMALYALDWSNLTIGTGAVLNVGLNTGVSTAGWSVGDAFKLFDWLGVIAGTPPSSGAFASINLPSLDAGKSWDTTQIFTSGNITIVPEPGRVLLVMLGLLGLAFHRRR